MKLEGGCYGGAVRYKAEGDPILKVQCHCRECQHVSGGSPNVTMGMPEAGFAYTKGAAKAFRRKDLPNPEAAVSPGARRHSDLRALSGLSPEAPQAAGNPSARIAMMLRRI